VLRVGDPRVLRSVGGVLGGTLVMSPRTGDIETCELSDFQLVEAG
jgi:hypothetical protein